MALCKPVLTFRDLPLELRLMIWGYVASTPRDIILDGKAKNEHHDTGNGWYCYNFRLYTPPPAILHVCWESREVGLKHYEIFHFRSSCLFCRTRRKPLPIRAFYINYEVDKICISDPDDRKISAFSGSVEWPSGHDDEKTIMD